MSGAERVTDLWVAAYRAGYEDAQHERDYDPGASMPGRILTETHTAHIYEACACGDESCERSVCVLCEHVN